MAIASTCSRGADVPSDTVMSNIWAIVLDWETGSLRLIWPTGAIVRSGRGRFGQARAQEVAYKDAHG